MAYSEHTADKHFHIVQKHANSAFAARQLAAIMHGNSSSMVSSREKKLILNLIMTKT